MIITGLAEVKDLLRLCMRVSVCVCWPKVIPRVLFTLFLRQGLLLAWCSQIGLGWLDSECQDPFASPVLSLQVRIAMSSLSDVDSGGFVCKAHTLLTEPSPQLEY